MKLRDKEGELQGREKCVKYQSGKLVHSKNTLVKSGLIQPGRG